MNLLALFRKPTPEPETWANDYDPFIDEGTPEHAAHVAARKAIRDPLRQRGKISKFFWWIPRWCTGCRRLRFRVIFHHQNTSYCDEPCNWVAYCPECTEINDQYWSERWSEYYSGCL